MLKSGVTFRVHGCLASVCFLMLIFAGTLVNAEHMANCRLISAAESTMLNGRTAVVTDIDGVLTQYILSDYGPTNGAFIDKGIAYPRIDAGLLMNIYHRLGYLIIYMAYRPRNLEIMGKSSCSASLDWLRANGFPVDKGNTMLLLIDGPDKVTKAENKGLAMAEWAGETMTRNFAAMIDAVKSHYGVDPQYGYVDSSVATNAFLNAGIPAGHIFTIGNKGMLSLGYKGTQPIMGPELNPGFTDHIKRFVVPRVAKVRK